MKKMSFRIDDILKKDESVKARETFFGEKTQDRDCISMNSCNNESILQKTLLSKNCVQYCRSISEPYLKINNNCNSWCQNERTCSNYVYFDAYKTKALSYPNVYVRTQMWPGYSTFPLSYLPHFSHLSKRKGGQVRFTANQTDALEKRFTAHKYLSPEDRRILADSLKLTDRQVKTWFQNRRAKWRRCSSHSDVSTATSEKEHNENKLLVQSPLSYPNVYVRTQMWPGYSTFPLSYLPHFSHLSKRKGGQVRFTANQTDALEKRFTAHKYLSPEDRRILADSLKLTDRQVKTWFQNRRAKWRRCSSHSDVSTATSEKEHNENKLLVQSRN